ncbi:RNA-splicing ligase RtcB [Syntrophotalea acetylenivorans]|uniref:tRNA-splicing ligase RtcB n=1 Tax=Syntrophotalea acetylenivorans TaxID=1842532 RepID=A0A1L3GQI7_9BACT|nr:RtcB family protein [Syntrophotalea acetylenivorans]APG28184.1 RNA-splicing ligase RtcB [Syntrophotalea acetylenivorans]
MAVKVEKIDECRWRIPREGAMRTEGLIYASRQMMAVLQREQALEQVRNVATLPGIVGPSLAMPDIHWGYGFPIGGVAAFDAEEGIVSPGGVGYDINCGVRLMRSSLAVTDVRPHLKTLADSLFQRVPSGVGSSRRDFRLNQEEERQVLLRGARWVVEQGLGTAEDLNHIEAGGCIDGADPEFLSDRALERGRDQLGTLGSGNHFIEVQQVEEIHDPVAADVLGLFPGQITVTIHTGSRGLGYQVCDDYLRVMLRAAAKYGITLPDRQLCCAPLSSPEGRQYLAAMACAANYAFANRQLITASVRQTFEEVLGAGAEALQLSLIYDVCHNIAKWEQHVFEGKKRRLCVHRKGATRAFPPGHAEIPACYRSIGQPVLIPGDMGRYSYVLVGTAGAMNETFGSICHGAGRVLSRHKAKKAARGRNIFAELADRGILLRAAGRGTVAEEISEAYKDVTEVVGVVQQAGIGRIVARLKPMAVIKG